MKIERHLHGSVVVIRVVGRLDAAWAEHFHGAVQEAIRDGRHQVRVDAAGMDYLSSAGIRALLRVRRELESVNGSFGLVHASPFVADTLRMSGLEAMLVPDDAGGDADASPSAVAAEPAESESGVHVDRHVMDPEGKIVVRAHAGWAPWRTVGSGDTVAVDFPRSRFGLGIGAFEGGDDDPGARFGEFAAASGCLAWLPGDGTDRPDYLEQADRFIPRVVAIQALVGEGTFSRLLRFRPGAKDSFLSLSDLLARALDETHSDSAAVVALAEVEGLVGVSLTQSPGRIHPGDRPGDFPDVRNWLAFCGERLFRQAQALLVAFVSRDPPPALVPHLASLPSRPEIHAHAHAVVLPFRPLPQGVLELDASVRAAFEESEPLGLYHLIEDDRPAVGLGQTTFIRGACWCAPLRVSTEPLS